MMMNLIPVVEVLCFNVLLYGLIANEGFCLFGKGKYILILNVERGFVLEGMVGEKSRESYINIRLSST